MPPPTPALCFQSHIGDVYSYMDMQYLRFIYLETLKIEHNTGQNIVNRKTRVQCRNVLAKLAIFKKHKA